jgi:UDP-GlcNAc3NAcA epimerase
MKLLTVVGARPQFVKAAVVSRALKASRTVVSEVIVHTGQHFDGNMSDVFFEEMLIPAPHHQLSLGGLSHGAMTGRMIEQIETLITTERPDCVLVYGDTNSTMAGALAAVKLHVPVAHVESGLRSFNRAMPEEINRVVTDHVSSLLFAPTDVACTNLANEGIPPDRVRRTGDVMLDAALFYAKTSKGRPFPVQELVGKDYLLSTIHRAENTDSLARLSAILSALGQIAQRLPVVLPLHPRTRQTVSRLGLDHLLAPLTVLPPVGYLDMVMLEQHCRLIATDSGGVQKEAYFFGKPCVTLRTETEWTELIAAGANTLVDPSDAMAIVASVSAALETRVDRDSALYGDGDAAGQIVRALVS